MKHPMPRPIRGYEHIRRYWDHHYHSCVAKVLPGEYYVTYQDEILITVVGSCITACIRDYEVGIGGMNHFMLPTKILENKWRNTRVSIANRYGNFAMEHMINEILKHGGMRQNLEVKLFGGGQIMSSSAKIGQQNIYFVKDYIRKEGLNLLAEDLGDIYPRKILFSPLTGKVRVKKLQAMTAMEKTVINQEDLYRRSIEEQSIEGDIDLW